MDPITQNDLTPEEQAALAARIAELEAEDAANARAEAVERLARAAVVTRAVPHSTETPADQTGRAGEQKARAFVGALMTGRGISTADDSAGALTPDEFVPSIMTRASKRFNLLRLGILTVRTMTRESQSFPVRVNSLASSDDAILEGTKATGGTNPAYKLIQLVAKKFGHTFPINEELVEDSPIDVVAEIVSQTGEDAGAKMERHVFVGTGTDLQPQGILTHEDVVKVPGPAYNADAEAYAMAIDGALNQFYFSFEQGYREDDSFAFATSSAGFALLNSLRVGGQKVLSAPTNEKPFHTLFGKPIVEVGAIPTAAGSTWLVGGAFNRYVLGLRKNVSHRLSDQAGEAFEQDQILVKYRMRWDGDVGVPEAFQALALNVAAPAPPPGE